MPRRPGRQGLFWTAVVLIALVAALDLVRGPSSYLRGWWSGMEPTRGEATRSWLERARDAFPR
jgi:hypothetical protein